MFKDLSNEIIKLNNGAKTIINCKKAKLLRKKLLFIGLPMTIIGFSGVFICFILFTIAGFNAVSNNSGFTEKIIIPFILFVPCGMIGGIGALIASLGFKILITEYSTNLVDEMVGNNCSVCGNTITCEDVFCSKCGTKLKKECPYCKSLNSIDNKFCFNCGKDLY